MSIAPITSMIDSRPSPERTDFWQEASGGVRGSRLLYFGAVLLLTAAALNVGGGVLRIYQPQYMVPVLKAAWLVWVIALWLVGAGFVWVGINQVLSRLGWVVGVLHISHGLFLLVTLFAGFEVAIPNVALAIGRLLALIIFVLWEKGSLGDGLTAFAAGAAGVLLVKIGVRLAGGLAYLSEAWLTVTDGVLLLALGWAMLALARRIRQLEEQWALEQNRSEKSSFNAFNNPQHPWNRDEQ